MTFPHLVPAAALFALLSAVALAAPILLSNPGFEEGLQDWRTLEKDTP